MLAKRPIKRKNGIYYSYDSNSMYLCGIVEHIHNIKTSYE
jgi:hypothetical protein